MPRPAHTSDSEAGRRLRLAARRGGRGVRRGRGPRVGDRAGRPDRGARLLLQTAIGAEATEFLGRERYARAATSDDARPGSRNGYCDTTIKTTTGPVTLSRPKLRGTTEAFASRLLGTGVTKTHALESLVIAGFVRGLSTRDVEATLAEALGGQATVSRSTVSRICTEIQTEMTTWQQRRLDEVELDYLFLDASFFRYHVGATAEPVLAAWGITTEGKPVFVGLDTSTAESTDARSGFLTDLGERGLRCPLLVISDGAPGLARVHHAPHRVAAAPGPAPHAARATHPAATRRPVRRRAARHCRGRRLASTPREDLYVRNIYIAHETRPKAAVTGALRLTR